MVLINSPRGGTEPHACRRAGHLYELTEPQHCPRLDGPHTMHCGLLDVGGEIGEIGETVRTEQVARDSGLATTSNTGRGGDE